MRFSLNFILKLLLIFFFILNVFLLNVTILGVNIRYVVFFVLCFISIVLHPRGRFLPIKTYKEIAIIFIMATILLFYSIAIMGNKFENALTLTIPYLTLLSIPLFRIMFRRYSIKAIIKIFVYITCLLSLYFVVIILVFLLDPSLAFSLIKSDSLVMFTVRDNIPRIFFKTSVFYIPVFTYCLIYIQGSFKKIILSLLCLFQILFFQTFGLFFGVFAVFLLYLLYSKKYKILIVSSILIVLSISFIAVNSNTIFSEAKQYSIKTKLSQLAKGFETPDIHSFLLGDGIGAPIAGLDERSLKKDFIVEVAPVMLYQMGGVIGAFLLIYIYSWTAIKGGLKSIKSNNKDIAFLSFSQIGMLFASISNPFIWSGGIGILFVSMNIAALYLTKTNNYADNLTT